MKKLFQLIIIASGVALLLSSCSRLENISVSKRHYRSGYTVDLGSHKQNVTLSQVSEIQRPVTSPSIVCYVEDNNVICPEKVIQAPAPFALTPHAEKKKQTYKHPASDLFASTRNISIIKEPIQDVSIGDYVASLPDVSTAAATSSSSSSAPMWVIILFAILIPPIGVALKFGIVDKFWISLILTLIFWLPGAIYSVIVVSE